MSQQGLKKIGGYIRRQTALDFKLNLDVVARKDTSQKDLSYTMKEL